MRIKFKYLMIIFIYIWWCLITQHQNLIDGNGKWSFRVWILGENVQIIDLELWNEPNHLVSKLIKFKQSLNDQQLIARGKTIDADVFTHNFSSLIRFDCIMWLKKLMNADFNFEMAIYWHLLQMGFCVCFNLFTKRLFHLVSAFLSYSCIFFCVTVIEWNQF